MAPTKRLRSPSPQLPLHLLTSLPSHSCPSTNNITTSLNPSQRLRLPPHLAHGIQAHEATVLTGFEELAGELEDAAQGEMNGEGGDEGRGTRGRRRVRWAGTFEREGEAEEEVVWTDRYDLLHLLTSLPAYLTSSSSIANTTTALSPSPLSQIGFAHLPETHEELFFFTPAERLELERKERRRAVEEGREARVRAAEERDAAAVAAEAALVESDEPNKDQLALMTRLHTTLSSSPNPSLLELRILANHGADPKFGFLRKGGRFRGVWEGIRRGEREGKEVRQEEEGKGMGMVGLEGYGSSSDEDGEADEDEEAVAEATPDETTSSTVAQPPPQPPLPSSAASSLPPDLASPPVVAGAAAEPEDEEAQREKQRLKRERAEEWARKRREKKQRTEEE